MKNNKTGKKIILGILLILLTIGVVTWARYYSSTEGDGSATIAYYDSGVAMADFPSLPTKPGESTQVQITVKNYGDVKKASEVKVKCWVEMETAENLPFIFEVTTAAIAGSETLLPYQESKDNIFTLEKLIQSKPYTIKAIWPEDKNDAKYAGLVDYVKIKVHIEQVTR